MIKNTSNLLSNLQKPSRVNGWFVLFWWGLSLGILAVLLITLGFKAIQGSVVTYIAIWLLIVLTLFYFLGQWSFSAKLGRQFDVLEIPVYLGLTFIFLIQAFGVAPYLDIKYLYNLPSLSHLPSGLLLTAGGLISMWVGYVLIRNTYRKTLHQKWKFSYTTPSLSLTLLAYIGIFAVRLLLIALGSGEMILGNKARIGGDWYQWLVYLIELRWFFIALVTLQVAAGHWPRRFFIFVLAVEGIMSFISGWSSLLPKIVLLVFGCWVYARRSISWKKIIPVGILVVAAVVFSIPIVRDLRSTRYVGPVTLSAISTSIRSTWGGGVSNGIGLFSDLLVRRQTATAQTPSILMYLIPKTVPYLPWQDLAVAPLTFIPRVLWPAKPVYTNVSSWLTVQVFGGLPESGSSAVTMVGNAYMYGGWSMTIIGMFTIGVVSAFMYRWLAVPGLVDNQVGLLAVYAGVVIANFHLGEGDFVSQWQGLIQRVIVFLVVATVLCMNPRRKTDQREKLPASSHRRL